MEELEGAAVSAEAQPAEVVEEVEVTEAEASGEVETSTEGEEAKEEEPKEEPTAAQKRIQELANLRREAENRAKALEERLNEVESKFTAQQQAPTVDVNALNTHLGTMREEIEFLRIDGKHLEADLKETERNALIREYQEWQKADKDRRTRVETERQQSAGRVAALKSFDNAVAFLAKEQNIPEAVMTTLGEVFSEVVQADKVFARELLETIQYQGPIKAAHLAHEKVKGVIAEREKAAIAEKAAKEAAKTTAAAVRPSGGTPTGAKGLSDDLPMDEWVKRREAQLNT